MTTPADNVGAGVLSIQIIIVVCQNVTSITLVVVILVD